MSILTKTIMKITKSLREEDKEEYEERAAIMEFDGGLSREEAEQKAYGSIK